VRRRHLDLCRQRQLQRLAPPRHPAPSPPPHRRQGTGLSYAPTQTIPNGRCVRVGIRFARSSGMVAWFQDSGGSSTPPRTARRGEPDTQRPPTPAPQPRPRTHPPNQPPQRAHARVYVRAGFCVGILFKGLHQACALMRMLVFASPPFPPSRGSPGCGGVFAAWLVAAGSSSDCWRVLLGLRRGPSDGRVLRW